MLRPNEGGAETGAEPKKKHPSFSAIAAQGLERGVVDYPDRFPERFGKIKTGPVFAEVFRVFHDFSVAHRSGKPDRDRLKIPVARFLLDFLDRLVRGELWAGGKFSPLFLLGNHQLDVGTADIDDENFFHRRSLGILLIGERRILPARCFSASFFAWRREISRNCNCACERGTPSSGFKRR